MLPVKSASKYFFLILHSGQNLYTLQCNSVLNIFFLEYQKNTSKIPARQEVFKYSISYVQSITS